MDERRYGDRFQILSRYERGELPGGGLDFSKRPAPFKEYPEARRFTLPEPKAGNGALSLGRTLRQRMSVRRFSETPLSLETLSYLVFATSGVRVVQGGFAFRTAPSAGALYPVETYLSVRLVEGLPPGVYHYAPLAHGLELLREGDYSRAVAAAALDQRMALSAAAVFVFSAIFERSRWKYRQRAYRYIYLDAGHMAQNLALAAASEGLGSCAIGAIYDDEANALLGLDGEEESVLYMTVTGIPR